MLYNPDIFVSGWGDEDTIFYYETIVIKSKLYIKKLLCRLHTPISDNCIWPSLKVGLGILRISWVQFLDQEEERARGYFSDAQFLICISFLPGLAAGGSP